MKIIYEGKERKVLCNCNSKWIGGDRRIRFFTNGEHKNAMCPRCHLFPWFLTEDDYDCPLDAPFGILGKEKGEEK